MRAVICLSGGMDSAVLLYHLLDQGHEVSALSVHYGQRHSRELLAAEQVAARAGVPWQLVDLSVVKPLLKGSSQTDEIPVPHGHYAEATMKQTVVPNRNMILLSLAIALAVSLRAEAVAYAAHAGDHTIYPDCRPEFVDAMDRAAHLCDWQPVSILRPFVMWTKGAIAQRGIELGVPFELTWTCYEGMAMPCGLCGACTERAEAFVYAGVADPALQ